MYIYVDDHFQTENVVNIKIKSVSAGARVGWIDHTFMHARVKHVDNISRIQAHTHA